MSLFLCSFNKKIEQNGERKRGSEEADGNQKLRIEFSEKVKIKRYVKIDKNKGMKLVNGDFYGKLKLHSCENEK